MRKIFLVSALISLALLTGCKKDTPSFTSQVNPFIGTGGHGHTFPGAIMPFGMIQLSPDTRLEGWDGCSGYHYSDDTIYGFSHTHLSGTGVPDYNDLLVMPTSGEPCFVNGAGENALCSYASPFDKDSEVARPGYYAVKLSGPGVGVELTASLRSGIHRYQWDKEAAEQGLILDLAHRDPVIRSGFRMLNDTTLLGYRVSAAWAREQHFYFAMRLSQPVKQVRMKDSAQAAVVPFDWQADSLGGVLWLGFGQIQGSELLVKVGISSADAEGALKNLEAEVAGKSFDQVKQEADAAWNRELGKIEVKGGTKAERTAFYTALYHTMVAPNLWSDVDGRYRGMDGQIHDAGDSPQYTVFSLWDTYRALHPLMTIIDRKRTGEFVRTFLRQFEQGGRLPVWELAANETECMIGYHSVPVIYDAYRKGIRDFDTLLALKAMQHSASLDHFGLKSYREYGYIPADLESESVSKTLEYAYDDWCIAMMAKEMGNDSVYQTFIRRAQSYKNLYDPKTRFFRPKVNSTFVEPFEPSEVNFHLTEANSWQYNFYVPQDIAGHAALMGGRETYLKMLDEMFSAATKTTGREQADITGLIGQYAHGNEPSHHMAYLYACLGKQHQTAAMVRRIMSEMYTDQPDGLCGNEDCGQMSAWYVLSAMGFYPVCPGSNQYVLGSPLFSEVKIHLENGEEFLIRARRNEPDNVYIRKAHLNGKPFNGASITHSEIMAGGDLRLLMGSGPNKDFGTDEKYLPITAITANQITPVPYISNGKPVFFGEQNIRLAHCDPSAKIAYHADPALAAGADLFSPDGARISGSTLIKASALATGKTPSADITAWFYQIPENRSIKLNTPYANQYAAGGDHALIDFLRGGTDFRTGRWQGYHQVNLDVVVTLEQEKRVKKITVGFLQDQNAWIFMPEEVTLQISTDGTIFHTLGVVKNTIPDRHKGAITHDFSASGKGQKAKYVRVIAKNRGVCPAWHPGAGEKAWIFADEIVVE
ncbi:MAG TPA: GH92 family glycosyl hydrolase [Bacteroidales bacterium]|nr:GH92 family glycosyl hydrolase [Bacteroidales bacterium]